MPQTDSKEPGLMTAAELKPLLRVSATDKVKSVAEGCRRLDRRGPGGRRLRDLDGADRRGSIEVGPS